MNRMLFITIFCCFFFTPYINAQEISSPVAVAETSVAQQENLALTNLTFDVEDFNFGTIHQGEKVTNVFTFTNTGTEPLVISQAKGSCGCTVPEWPKEPIAPGETGQFLVQFDSKGKKGKQSKRVTITANTSPAQSFITIRGEIYSEGESSVLPTAVVTSKTKTAGVAVEQSGNAQIDVNDFLIFPNPTANQLSIKLKDHFGQAARIDIFNKLGQLMQSKEIQSVDAAALDFDVSEFAAGTYTVSVKVDGFIRVAKQVAIVK